jgi:hypothetical protein
MQCERKQELPLGAEKRMLTRIETKKERQRGNVVTGPEKKRKRLLKLE